MRRLLAETRCLSLPLVTNIRRVGGWVGGLSVGVGLCVGFSGTLTVRVYVVQVHSLPQIRVPGPCESNSRASAAPHPCPGDSWALCLCTGFQTNPQRSSERNTTLVSASRRFALLDSGTSKDCQRCRELQTVKFHKTEKDLSKDHFGQHFLVPPGNGNRYEKLKNKKNQQKSEQPRRVSALLKKKLFHYFVTSFSLFTSSLPLCPLCFANSASHMTIGETRQSPNNYRQKRRTVEKHFLKQDLFDLDFYAVVAKKKQVIR